MAADPNHYDVTRQVAAATPSTGGNEPKQSHNPAPKTGTDQTPAFMQTGRC